MLNLAHRHRRAARKAGPKVAERRDYVILDKHHRPDLRGELAGAKVIKRGDKQIVSLTAKQARFYLDQGAIEPHQPHPKEAAPQKDTAPVAKR